MKKSIFISLITALTLTVFSSCASKSQPVGGEVEDTTVTTVTSETTTPPPPADSLVKITAAGDNLIHSSIYNQAKKRSTDGTYNFDYAYENVEKLINGDINILNQETLVCNDVFEPSTYPCFNSPTQLGDKMISLGFNAFNLANNHCLDRGMKGSFAALDYWGGKNVITCGMYRNSEDRDKIRTLTKNDVTFSFLGFTEHTNGLRIAEDSELEVVYTSDEAEIQKEITEASKISDMVVVSVHWGTENSHTINDAQRALAQKMSDWGADIIIGTHPHVIQGVEELTAADGRKTLVAYSLGNFISAQDVNSRMIGGMLDFDVRKSYEKNTVTYENVKFIPVVTHYDYSFANIRIYPFSDYTKELASKHGVNVKSSFSYDFIVQTLKDNINEKYLALN